MTDVRSAIASFVTSEPPGVGTLLIALSSFTATGSPSRTPVRAAGMLRLCARDDRLHQFHRRRCLVPKPVGRDCTGGAGVACDAEIAEWEDAACLKTDPA